MSQVKVQCPNCNHKFSVDTDSAMEQEIKANLESRFSAQIEELEKRSEQDKESLRKKAEADIIAATQQVKVAFEEKRLAEVQKLQEEKDEAERRAEEAKQREATLLNHEAKLKARERELEAEKASVELDVQNRLNAEFTKQKLDFDKKLAEQKNLITKAIQEQVNSERELQDAEKDKLIGDLRKNIEELKQKSVQGSQQTQGEVLELELERVLREAFPNDTIDEVKKGVQGADVTQGIVTRSGQSAGTLVWEAKRTKNWTPGWIQKLKDDQRAAKADFAILVSTVLPKEITRIGNIDGVWVCDFESAIGVASLLRTGLLEVARTRAVVKGREDKAQQLYDYITSQTFIEKMKAIIESYAAMREDLDAEKRVMERVWAKREASLDRLRKSTAALLGEIQATATELGEGQLLRLPG